MADTSGNEVFMERDLKELFDGYFEKYEFAADRAFGVFERDLEFLNKKLGKNMELQRDIYRLLKRLEKSNNEIRSVLGLKRTDNPRFKRIDNYRFRC